MNSSLKPNVVKWDYAIIKEDFETKMLESLEIYKCVMHLSSKTMRYVI